ncbi:DUF4166 domain-containing protein [Alkalicoccobacillus murimartini]|uniref:DUF4166 domain-containing protein n=1 Tax=Alkalicoccobacillus murimartini TaxID=171685 RepID=A0ABT9YIA3_9BACI|nr:DUF4166 domain-containing protein [Alkalicoccobacillus murimartini]MDQ0207592.1 hypothetical protein [Alkalicoccobacillus murimartini]
MSLSLYKQMLGVDFEKLHPKLQDRYSFSDNNEFLADGVMSEIQSGKKWLYPLLLLGTRRKFLFPESGKNVPFEIVNRSIIRSDGKEEVQWERLFHFPNATRRFHARMTADIERGVVKDYLGEPSLFYSDLIFNVTEQGSLTIRSAAQRIVVGAKEIPLPGFLQGMVFVEEAFDDFNEEFTINVMIRNPVVGRLMYYDGVFKKN